MAKRRSDREILRPLPFTIERSDLEGPGSWVPHGNRGLAGAVLPYPLQEDWDIAYSIAQKAFMECGRGDSEDRHPEYARAIADYRAANRALDQVRKDQDSVSDLKKAREALARDKLRMAPARQAARDIDRVLEERGRRQVVVLYLAGGYATYIAARTFSGQVHHATEDWLAWRLKTALESEEEPIRASHHEGLLDPATSIIAETFKLLRIGKTTERAGDSAIRNRISDFKSELSSLEFPADEPSEDQSIPLGFQGIFSTPEEAAKSTSSETGISAFLPVVFRAVGASGVTIEEFPYYQLSDSMSDEDILEYFEKASEQLGLGVSFGDRAEQATSCRERDGKPLVLPLPTGPLASASLIDIAHDLGHLECVLGPTPPWLTDAKGQQICPSFEEEATAWANAEEHLRRLGFQDWATFYVRKSEKLERVKGIFGGT